jgi:hypothetical protein
VAFEGKESVVADHAATVVSDADKAAATGFDFDADVSSSGIEGVLQEFFDDGGGTVDDFAGGDLVGDLVGENSDAAHRGFKDMRFSCEENWDTGNRMWRIGSVLDGREEWHGDCAGLAHARGEVRRRGE